MAPPRDPRRSDAGYEYSYRRPLTLRELLPAIGAGIGAGAAAFYLVRLFTQRTPLRPERAPRALSSGRPVTRRAER